MSYQVTRMPIWTIIVYFLLYIVCHIAIDYMARYWTDKFEYSKHSKNIKRSADVWNFLNKWFPAMYVVFLLVMFYF